MSIIAEMESAANEHILTLDNRGTANMLILTEVWKHTGDKPNKPKLPHLDAMRKGRSELEAYAFFCYYFLSAVVGKTKWEKATQTGAPVSTDATTSDEAMALLLLENCWDYWEWMAWGHKDDEGQGSERNPAPEVLYTSGCGKMARKMSGWSKRGIAHYNEICKKVDADHRSDAEKEQHERFDRYYFQKCSEYHGLPAQNSDNEDEGDDENEMWVEW